MIYKVATALALVAAASATLYTEDHVSQKSLWEDFKQSFGKTYETMEEEQSRFTIFLENLKLVDRRNELEVRAGGSAVHGITRFSDMSQAEFESSFLTSMSNPEDPTVEEHVSTTPVDETLGLVDWTNKYTKPVRDQGRCGSCWAFSATEQIESDFMRKKGSSNVLSVEQVTQCSSGCYGCNGGFNSKAFSYAQSHSITTDSAYPYTSYAGVTGTCKPPSGSIKIASYTKVTGESKMASYVQGTGPLSICLDASNWSSYTGGILKTCGNSVNHCVQAVGVEATSSGYWKIRNSWGTGWGESGFIRLAYGKNLCNLQGDSYYSTPL